MSEEKIGVIGSGLIGRSFSMLFVSAGYKVVVYDIEPKQLEAAKNDIWKQLVSLEDQGLLRGKLTKEKQFENISTTTLLDECIRGAFLYSGMCTGDSGAQT
ncbi:Crystallin, lambda 1 [Bulinus truncatus]|nr:Crystallin, lambda 1 [Bulinus truncatus]